MFSDIASLRARPLSVNWRMRAIRLQYSVSHEAFFVVADSISASALRFKPLSQRACSATNRAPAEPRDPSRGTVERVQRDRRADGTGARACGINPSSAQPQKDRAIVGRALPRGGAA